MWDANSPLATYDSFASRAQTFLTVIRKGVFGLPVYSQHPVTEIIPLPRPGRLAEPLMGLHGAEQKPAETVAGFAKAVSWANWLPDWNCWGAATNFDLCCSVLPVEGQSFALNKTRHKLLLAPYDTQLLLLRRKTAIFFSDSPAGLYVYTIIRRTTTEHSLLFERGGGINILIKWCNLVKHSGRTTSKKNSRTRGNRNTAIPTVLLSRPQTPPL